MAVGERQKTWTWSYTFLGVIMGLLLPAVATMLELALGQRQVTLSNELAGSSQVKLIVDRRTGWLRRKEQKTSLSGQIKQSPADGQGTETAIDTTMEITTIVEPVE